MYVTFNIAELRMLTFVALLVIPSRTCLFLQDGVGRRGGGEGTEVFWYQLGPFCKLARYMTLAHWRDGFNMTMELLVKIKQRAFPQLLQSKARYIQRKEKEVANEIAILREKASKDSVLDLDAALAEYIQEERTPVSALTKPAQYVHVLMQLDAHTAMRANSAAVTLLPASTGVNLHKRTMNPKTEDDLKQRRRKLEAELKVPPWEQWSPESSEYKGALEELKRHEGNKHRRKAEEIAFRRYLLLQELRQQSGSEAQRIRDNMRRLRDQIASNLEIVATWNAWGTQTERVAVTEAVIRDACDNKFPWGGGDSPAGSTAAARRHYAVQYRVLDCQRKRTEEEGRFLKSEILRTMSWLEERLEEAGNAMEMSSSPAFQRRVKEAYPDASEAAVARHITAYCKGRQAWLAREKAWLFFMQDEARVRLATGAAN